MTSDISSTDGFADQLQAKIDGKTKPLGSLGRMEALAAQIAKIQNTLSPQMKTCRLTIFAADHGMAEIGVSAFPQSVTRQMVLNFLAGGAAANVFANTLGIAVDVVDAGVAGDPIEHNDLISRRLGAGTANAIMEPAMSPAQCDQAMAYGEKIGAESNSDAVCFGEMGIGNTSSATLIAHKMLGLPLGTLIGRGTGLDDDGLSRKHKLLFQATQRTADTLSPSAALQEYGGFEIAMMTGAMLASARNRKLVIVDGFIATSAAIAATEIDPSIKDSLVYAHKSEEHGHGAMLDALDAHPLLDLGMRLGEGTGALLAWPLIQSAAAMLNDMASFDSAGVSGPS